jgi:hypothetical protein
MNDPLNWLANLVVTGYNRKRSEAPLIIVVLSEDTIGINSLWQRAKLTLGGLSPTKSTLDLNRGGQVVQADSRMIRLLKENLNALGSKKQSNEPINVFVEVWVDRTTTLPAIHIDSHV